MQVLYQQNAERAATFCGILVLLLAVEFLVIVRTPDFPSGPTFTSWFALHQSMYNYNEAKVLVKPLIKEPVEKWSRQLLDPETSCIEAGNGVWHATGTVDTISREGMRSHQSWSIYFEAETATSLYCKVGKIESGDLAQALKLARAKSSTGDTGPLSQK